MPEIALGEWMIARERENKGKTKVWELWSKAGPSFLGYVVWSTGWRRYVLQAPPSGAAQFDAGCLRTIAEFLDARTTEQRATWKRPCSA